MISIMQAALAKTVPTSSTRGRVTAGGGASPMASGPRGLVDDRDGHQLASVAAAASAEASARSSSGSAETTARAGRTCPAGGGLADGPLEGLADAPGVVVGAAAAHQHGHDHQDDRDGHQGGAEGRGAVEEVGRVRPATWTSARSRRRAAGDRRPGRRRRRRGRPAWPARRWPGGRRAWATSSRTPPSAGQRGGRRRPAGSGRRRRAMVVTPCLASAVVSCRSQRPDREQAAGQRGQQRHERGAEREEQRALQQRPTGPQGGRPAAEQRPAPAG